MGSVNCFASGHYRVRWYRDGRHRSRTFPEADPAEWYLRSLQGDRYVPPAKRGLDGRGSLAASAAAAGAAPATPSLRRGSASGGRADK
jgi:hypothetical protein